MVKGGYYKLLAKSSSLDNPDSVTIGKPPKHCLHRLKPHLIAAVFLLVICVFGLNFIYPLSRNSHQALSSENGESTTPGARNESIGRNRIRYKHTIRKLPECIIIGARKAGTRALLTFLNLHPHILTAKQEVHFFDDNYDLGLEWYRKEMPYSFPEQITMEKTPAYFVSSDVPARIHDMNSSIKLLLIVRNPVDRTISDYNQIMHKKHDRNKHIASFEELAVDHNGNINESYNAIRRSRYSHYMRKWLRYFPLKQFHIVNGEGLVDNPLPHIHAVEDFLGLEHRITKDNFYFNVTRGFYCIRNETMEKCLNPSKGREHPYVRPEVLSKLRAYFRPYNEEFYRLVQKDFGWQ